jgi:hypothetical protein
MSKKETRFLNENFGESLSDLVYKDYFPKEDRTEELILKQIDIKTNKGTVGKNTLK